jgi:hypothetical protein
MLCLERLVKSTFAVVGALVVVTVLGVSAASAIPADCPASSSTCFQPDVVITGKNPTDSFPWLTVEVEQVGDDIFIAMRADFAAKGFIGKVWMNVADATWLPALTFEEFTVNEGALAAPEITKRSNKLSPTVGKAGKFDLLFDFANGNPQRFNRHDEFQFRVTCPGCTGFDVEAFDALSTGGKEGAFSLAAHVQGYGGNAKVGDGSEEPVFMSFSAPSSFREAPPEPQQVPHPMTLLLVAIGLVVAIGARARQVSRP